MTDRSAARLRGRRIRLAHRLFRGLAPTHRTRSRGGHGRIAALAAALCGVAGLAVVHAQDPPAPLAVTLAARAIAPGEVIRMDIRAGEPVSSVHVKAFDRTIPAAPVRGNVWRALVGIDLDTAPGDYPMAIEGTTPADTLIVLTDSLHVEPKEFPTRTLRVAPKYVRPPARVQARIAREAARLHELFSTVSPVPLWRGPFALPIPGAVVSGFGVRSIFNGEPRAPHGGADLRGRAGTPVRAPNGGRVVLVARLYFTGTTVVVDHGMGLLSLFAHLSRVNVGEGQIVRTGSVIGAVGATGRVTGPHLHWTVRLQDARVDPISLIDALANAGTPSGTDDSRKQPRGHSPS